MSFERYEEGDDDKHFSKSALSGCLIICYLAAAIGVGLYVLISLFYY